MLGIFSAIPSLIVLSACDGPLVTSTRHTPAESIAGRWIWVSSFHVQTQELHTPSSTHFDAELRLEARSSHTGAFTYLRSGAATTSGTFTIGSEDAPGNDFIVLSQPIDFLKRNAWMSVFAVDTLRLAGVMEAGYNSKYVRAK